MIYSRYVALGDSSTEGLEDPGTDGRHRGWADRLAQHVADAQRAPLQYANLAVRGRKTRHLVEEQLAPALAMQPDLATVFSGTNDIIRSNFSLDSVMADLRTLHTALRGAGATVLTITMPDLSEVAPFARRARPRLLAFNEAVCALCAETGVLLLDVARFPSACDPRLWHEDRLHANAEGHRRIAAGLAHTLGLSGFDDSWAAALPPAPAPNAAARAAEDLRWASKYLFPWLLRRALGRSSGDGVEPKYPQLRPVLPG
ncbi:MAG: SGNH/GDSL hydrolase family protein [Gemmatimonadaceae bacterium]|nr:SGNH/GDSL hydrolase family protein [Gemmatimonadaceae bacterium]MCW5826898.1 SGNH/GDSL hydrolase family protein [Gemmatimonadaceae bacterium]